MNKILLVFMLSILSIFCQKQPEEKNMNTSDIEPVRLPEYEIIEEIKLISGEKMGEVLIKSYSRNTPISEREKVVREIAKRKGYDRLDLYCTLEAQKANYSSSFNEKHPDALKIGYLGKLEKGKFTPGEKVYP